MKAAADGGPHGSKPQPETNVRREKAKGRSSGGSFLALPHALLRSPNFIALSASAVKLAIDMAVAYNGANNGDLAATWNGMKARGWKSRASLTEALRELRHYGLLEQTRQGGMHKPSLYGLTWLGIDHCAGKLDVPANRAPSGAWKTQVGPFERPSRKTKRQHAGGVDSPTNDTRAVSIAPSEASNQHAGGVVQAVSAPGIDTPAVSLLRNIPRGVRSSGLSPSGSEQKRGRPQGETPQVDQSGELGRMAG